MDDTLRTGKQAESDTFMARLQAGLMPGMEHFAPETMDELETMYERAAALGPKTLMVFNVDRDRAEKGLLGGAAAAYMLMGLPKNVHGNTMLCFAGWDDDPREAYTIPEVVDFCRGLLLGKDMNDVGQAQRVLTILIPEHVKGINADGSVNPEAFKATGALFLVACCFPEKVWEQTPEGVMRDLGMNIQLLYSFFPAPTEE